MSKELEALEEIYNWIYCNCGGTTYEDDVKLDKIRKIIELALQRLEQIDNANPSEALGSLHKIASKVELADNDDYWEVRNAYAKVENTLIKAQENEKVLEIIKEKKVNIDLLYASSSVEQYNDELVRVYGMWFVKDRQLTQDEFDLLKRWLNE